MNKMGFVKIFVQGRRVSVVAKPSSRGGHEKRPIVSSPNEKAQNNALHLLQV